MTPQTDGHATPAPTTGAIRAGQVDDRLPTPLHHQIYLILRNKILTGEYPVETVLPPCACWRRTGWSVKRRRAPPTTSAPPARDPQEPDLDDLIEPAAPFN